MPPQLSLWSDDDHTPSQPHITDARPLPLLVAEKWQFPLQYHIVEGVYWFSVNDWIAGVSEVSDTRNTMSGLKRRSPELFSTWKQLPYQAKNNRVYQMAHGTDEALYDITQRLDKSTGAVKAVLSFLSKSGVLFDAARRDSATAAQVSDQLDKLHGRVREDSIDARKFFTAAAQDTHYLNKPKIGLLTNENYKALFGLAKRELCMELGLSPDSNALRDNMNRYALLAITAVETHAAELMRQLGRPLTDDEQIAVGRKTAATFRPVFEAAASEVGQTLTDARLGAPVAKRVKS